MNQIHIYYLIFLGINLLHLHTVVLSIVYHFQETEMIERSHSLGSWVGHSFTLTIGHQELVGADGALMMIGQCTLLLKQKLTVLT